MDECLFYFLCKSHFIRRKADWLWCYFINELNLIHNNLLHTRARPIWTQIRLTFLFSQKPAQPSMLSLFTYRDLEHCKTDYFWKAQATVCQSLHRQQRRRYMIDLPRAATEFPRRFTQRRINHKFKENTPSHTGIFRTIHSYTPTYAWKSSSSSRENNNYTAEFTEISQQIKFCRTTADYMFNQHTLCEILGELVATVASRGGDKRQIDTRGAFNILPLELNHFILGHTECTHI